MVKILLRLRSRSTSTSEPAGPQTKPRSDHQRPRQDLQYTIQTSSWVVELAKTKGWLTTFGQPESTTEKGGSDASTTTTTTEASNPAPSSSTGTVGATEPQKPPGVVQPQPEAPPAPAGGSGDTPDQHLVDQVAEKVGQVLRNRPGVDSAPPWKSVSALTVEAFQYLETGAQMVDVMVELNLTFEQAKSILENYHALKQAESEGDHG